MRIGNWDIIKVFAVGRWSKVAMAKPYGCQSNNADYIIKYVDQDSSHFEFARQMLIREHACSKLVSHASLISFLDGNPDHKIPYLVSARHPGESLQQYQEGYSLVIDLRDKLTCFRQICEGVAKLHELGIRHGDLSPSNLLIDTERRQSLIVDLGMSEKVNPFQQKTDAVGGTWGYLAPECLHESAPVNLTADIYSLGTTVRDFFLPTGAKGTVENSSYSLIRTSLRELLDSMIENNPLKRPTVHEVVHQVSLLEIGCMDLDYRAA